MGDVRWVEGNLVLEAEGVGENELAFIYCMGIFFQVERETVGQYVEMQDKYEKRIFEGDRVRVRYDNELLEGTVMFEKGSFVWKGAMTLQMGMFKSNRWEIVGNVHVV